MKSNHVIEITQSHDLLYIIYIEEPHLCFVAYDDKYNKMVEFKLSVRLSGATKPAIDEDFIYVSTAYGEVLALDKYSGEIIHRYDIGRSIIFSDIIIHNDSIYLLSKIPVKKGNKIHTHFQVNKINKEDGTSLKSTVISAGFCSLSKTENHLYLIADKTITEITENLNLSGMKNTIAIADKKVCEVDNTIVLFSKSGTAQILNENKEHVRAFPINRQPKEIVSYSTGIYVICNDGSYDISINKQAIQRLTIPPMDYSASFCDGSKLVAGTTSGFIVLYNIESKTFLSVKVSSLPILSVMSFKSKLIVSSMSEVKEVQINNE